MSKWRRVESAKPGPASEGGLDANDDIAKAEDLAAPNYREEAVIETHISLLRRYVKAARGVRARRVVQGQNVGWGANVKEELENTASSSE